MKLSPNALIEIYQDMTEEERQGEIDAVFEIIYALLEACACDSIDQFPNPNIKLSFRCDVIKNETKYYC